MFTAIFFLKCLVIGLMTIAIGILLFKRIRSNKKVKTQLKHNISLLREEKLLMHSSKKLQKKRQQLLKRNSISEYIDAKQLISKSRKLGLPAGEILLAAKIRMNCK